MQRVGFPHGLPLIYPFNSQPPPPLLPESVLALRRNRDPPPPSPLKNQRFPASVVSPWATAAARRRRRKAGPERRTGGSRSRTPTRSHTTARRRRGRGWWCCGIPWGGTWTRATCWAGSSAGAILGSPTSARRPPRGPGWPASPSPSASSGPLSTSRTCAGRWRSCATCRRTQTSSALAQPTRTTTPCTSSWRRGRRALRQDRCRGTLHRARRHDRHAHHHRGRPDVPQEWHHPSGP